MVDAAIQRLNMVESQVRPSDVVDRRILAAMGNIKREKFVPAAKRSLAYMDEAIQLETDSEASPRVLLPPRLLAKMVQNLELEDTDLVLDIACATGYSTAVLAAIAQTVVGLECDAGLADQASKALGEAGVDNAVVVKGAIARRLSERRPLRCHSRQRRNHGIAGWAAGSAEGWRASGRDSGWRGSEPGRAVAPVRYQFRSSPHI